VVNPGNIQVLILLKECVRLLLAAGCFTGTWRGVGVLAIAKRSPDMELRSLDFSPMAVTQSGLDDFTSVSASHVQDSYTSSSLDFSHVDDVAIQVSRG
jgi:hypothetical protein